MRPSAHKLLTFTNLLLLINILAWHSKRLDAWVLPTKARYSLCLHNVPDPKTFHTDEEWHPHDPAETTPQLLAGLWNQIAQGASMNKGETTTVIYPNMQNEFTPRYLNLIMGHLDYCKDVCDHFGITTTLVPYTQKGKIVGFTSKSFRDPLQSKKGEYDFKYDPFWDDGTDFEELYDGIDDHEEGGSSVKDPYPAIVNKIPDDDQVIIDITKNWVEKIMSDMGICPFTNGAEMAGLPLGQVYYHVDRSNTPEDVYACYWQEVVRLEQQKEKDLSTELLIIPEFMMDNVELFESFTNSLTQPLAALGVEDLLQLVFFHPHWSFRDGEARSGGQAQAANYARRSPWPMINLLRTKQVRAAQKGIPTGLVYKQNEKTLASVGVDKLETMLRLRDWSDIQDLKVNRKEYDALKIARDFQETGKVASADLSLMNDATPAANKVDRQQVEKGNLIKVLSDALDKRLGKSNDNQQGPQPLSGPETSAVAMAGDFLIQELERIAQSASSSSNKSTAGKIDAPTVPATSYSIPETPLQSQRVESVIPNTTDIQNNSSSLNSDNQQNTVASSLSMEELRRQARIAAARQAMLDDLKVESAGSERGDQMTDILFGKGGIPKNSGGDDELYQDGMNPDSFY